MSEDKYHRIATFFILGFLVLLSVAVIFISRNIQYQGLNFIPRAAEINSNSLNSNYYVPNGGFENWTLFPGSRNILIPANWTLKYTKSLSLSYRDVGYSGKYAFKTPKFNPPSSDQTLILQSDQFNLNNILYRNAEMTFFIKRLATKYDGLIYVQVFTKLNGVETRVCGFGVAPDYSWSQATSSCYLPGDGLKYYIQISVQNNTQPILIDNLQIKQSPWSTPVPTNPSTPTLTPTPTPTQSPWLTPAPTNTLPPTPTTTAQPIPS